MKLVEGGPSCHMRSLTIDMSLLVVPAYPLIGYQ